MHATRPDLQEGSRKPAQPRKAPSVLTALAVGLCLALGAVVLLIGIGTAHAIALIASPEMAYGGDFGLVAVSSVLASALVCVMALRRQLGRTGCGSQPGGRS